MLSQLQERPDSLTPATTRVFQRILLVSSLVQYTCKIMKRYQAQESNRHLRKNHYDWSSRYLQDVLKIRYSPLAPTNKSNFLILLRSLNLANDPYEPNVSAASMTPSLYCILEQKFQ